MANTVIIGGGITGLSAAWELLKRKRSVLVIERERVGGLVMTKLRDGFTLECGPNVILDKPDLRSLISETGLADNIVHPKYRLFRQHIWFNNKLERVPKDPISFIRTPLIDGENKKQILPWLFLGRVPSAGADDCSVAEFWRPVIGETAVTRLLAPAMRGIYGSSVHELSARTVFPKLFECGSRGGLFREYLAERRKEGRGRVFTLRGGVSVLTERLRGICAERGAILRGSVAGICHQDDGKFQVRLEDNSAIAADRVIVSTCGPRSAKFVSELDTSIGESLNAMDFVSIAVVHVAVSGDAGLPKRSFGVLFPKSENGQLLGAMFNSSLFPHVAPGGRHLVTVMAGGSECGDLLNSPDEELFELVKAELPEAIGVRRPELLNVTRWKEAIPVYPVNHHRTVMRLRDLERMHSGLFFAGTDLGLPGVADRVSQGKAAAVRADAL